jgi:putative spermidine/putrescine transport system permease protein
LLAIGLFLLHRAVLDLEHHSHDFVDPLLGKEGLINMALLRLGVVHQPLEFLLFSDLRLWWPMYTSSPSL